MNKEKSSYRNIMKATSILGGVQIINIIFKIIGSKFVAVLLGPTGIGVMGLFNTSITFISSITNFGLGASPVRDISEANSCEDSHRVAVIVKVVRRLVWFTGFLGAIITCVFSSWISELTFGNTDYTYAFMVLSITLLFNQLSNGQKVLLQGLRKINHLAKSTLIGSLFGLILTVPFYYFYGNDGIVPGIIITSLVALLTTWRFSSQLDIKDVDMNMGEILGEGKSMIIMGFLISLGGMMSAGSAYLIRIYINSVGGVDQVGLFNAGFAIINTYAGLVFTAMATDYYPRLASVAHSNILSKNTINQQAEISLLILSPILILFLVFIKWFIILLYSTKFIGINEMLYWAVLGIFFKAISWSIGFIFLSKGESKLYFWNELIATIYCLVLNILGFCLMGLKGLGISFMLSYLIHVVQVYVVSKKRFEFAFDQSLIKIFIIQFGLALLGFLVMNYLNGFSMYIIGVSLVIISSWYSIVELDKRIDLKEMFRKIR